MAKVISGGGVAPSIGESNIPTSGIPGALVGFNESGDLVASADLAMLAKSGAFGEGLSAKTTTVEDNLQASDPDTGNACQMDPNDGLTFNATNVTPIHLAGIVEADPSAENPLIRADNAGLLTEAQATVLANTSGTNTGDQTSVSGNAGTATKLATARKINGIDFDGSGDIALPGNILHDTQANRPAASKAGLEFCPTDGCGPVRQIDNGSSYDGYYLGLKCSPPPAAADLSQIHFSLSAGTASLTDAGPCLLMTQTGNNSTSARDLSAAVVAIPASGAYSLEVGMDIAQIGEGYCMNGLVVTDGNGSTPKMMCFLLSGGNPPATAPAFFMSKETNPTTNSSAASRNIPLIGGGGRIFIKFYDDRTNISWWISHDGRNWVRWYTEARAAFLTPAYVGICCGQQGSTQGGAIATTLTRSTIKVYHWALVQ